VYTLLTLNATLIHLVEFLKC